MNKEHYQLTVDEWTEDTRRRTGHIGRYGCSRGQAPDGQRADNRYEAVIQVQGEKYRHRSSNRYDCETWLKAVLSKRILPTDHDADWLRAEQRRDMAARYEQMAASNCEEGLLLYDYYQTGDIAPIAEYIERSLLPHLIYYACHTVRLGLRTSVIYSREAVACLLTKVAAGRMVMNMTAFCKGIIRTKRYGNEYYYLHMPKDMRLVVDGIDYAPLEQLWRVTRDKRI